jgi:hypothetical protein
MVKRRRGNWFLRSVSDKAEDYEMRKGFTRTPQADAPVTQTKNYITPSGLERLKDEHRFLLTRERPAVTEVVARGLPAMAIAVTTPTIGTASGDCVRSMGGFAFSRSESKPRGVSHAKVLNAIAYLRQLSARIN